MTNGGGPPHGHERKANAAKKNGKVKEQKGLLRRKGWLPAGLAKAKSGERR